MEALYDLVNAGKIRSLGASSPIIGAIKTSHLDDPAAAVELELTDAEVERLESPYVPRSPTSFKNSGSMIQRFDVPAAARPSARRGHAPPGRAEPALIN